MPRSPSIRSSLSYALLLGALACGGSSDSPTGPPVNAGNSGGARTMTATYNGTGFNPTILTSVYLSNQVGVNASDGKHNLAIAATNITNPGTYSVAPGDANSAIANWIDDTGDYSCLSAGSGTVRFKVLELGRVAGSFNFVAKTTATSTQTKSMNVVGTFDIKFP
jgi:hypothetical protein